ncbi:ATP-dependent DNA helicase [Mycoplasmatota bacterium WC44]
MKEIKISVRKMVEFLHSGGDLTSEYFQNNDMLDGTRVHQYWQNKYGLNDEKEVSVFYEHEIDDYKFVISGRIDGVLNDGSIIEEIKSTKGDLSELTVDSRPQHLAQAKMYAYIYLLNNSLKSIKVRLTYIKTDDYENVSFDKRYNISQLEKFFVSTLNSYLEWQKVITDHKKSYLNDVKKINFPFDKYREGQRDLMGGVYQTIKNNEILYSIAPTGIGKTMATLFSSLKTIKKSKEKIFYLTAKNAGKRVALSSLELLKENGLNSKTIELTSKDSICFLEERECTPEACKYAKGFFDRLKEATRDIYKNESIITKKILEEYAEKHTVCPFEYSLYVSYFTDIIICDYNYAFCPKTHLKRYFEEKEYKPILLVDEAHNLISRSKSMYSAELNDSVVKKLKILLNSIKPSVSKEINNLLDSFDILGSGVSFESYKDMDHIFIEYFLKLYKKINEILIENQDFKSRNDVVNIYFELMDFYRIIEFYNESYVFLVDNNKGIKVSLSCLDASKYILKTIKDRCFGTVFFSATMFPLDYYKQLLTSGEGNHMILKSPFPQENLSLFIVDDVSTKYKDRDSSIDKIVDTIKTMVNSKKGKYIVFFPSYAYLDKVSEQLDVNIEKIVQKRNMTYSERVEYMNMFSEDSSLLGMFVMGGIFSEGIDYVGDMLSGVIIVGVGLPMYGDYNNLLKSYFDEKFNNGFDYAYTYPGINKVIQSVGRVIRTESDRGVAILIDERFSNNKYQNLFPREWSHKRIINNNKRISTILDKFWSE